MLKKRIVSLMCLALVIGLMSGCGTNSNTNKNKKENPGTAKTETPTENKNESKFEATLEIKQEKQDVVVTYKVRNSTGTLQKLNFSSGLEADYILYDGNGHVLKKYSDEVLATQALKEVKLDKNQEISRVFKIPGLANGSYKIEVFLLAKEVKAKVIKPFDVRNSIYQHGEGKLVGLADPHTIEVNIDGKAVAFQLSDQAREQIKLYKDGDPIFFIYIENDSGQKVIKWFEHNKMQ